MRLSRGLGFGGSHVFLSGRGSLGNATLVACTLMFAAQFSPRAQLSGQVIRGVVVDDKNLSRVAGASVLLTREEEIETGAETDDSGRFLLQSFQAGAYRVEVRRMGYETARSQKLMVESGDTVVVEFRLSPDAIVLSPLTIMGHSKKGRDAFERRRLSADRGIFLTPEMIDSIAPYHPSDVLRGLDKLDVRWGRGPTSTGGMAPIPSVRSFLGRGCLLYMVDFMQVDPPPWTSGDWSSFLLGGLEGREVVAVEVYRSVLEVPDDLLRFTHRTRTVSNGRGGFRVVDDVNCGLVVFWTRQGW